MLGAGDYHLEVGEDTGYFGTDGLVTVGLDGPRYVAPFVPHEGDGGSTRLQSRSLTCKEEGIVGPDVRSGEGSTLVGGVLHAIADHDFLYTEDGGY